jgi:alkylhydroperoxidase/carboxymuconolactone decarboxylase family protein YurZ
MTETNGTAALLDQHRRINEERGYSFSTFEWLAKHDPEFEATRLQAVEMTYTRKDAALSVKTRELIVCGILAFRMYHTLSKHIERAMREGATLQEVIQTFEMASVPGGQATLHYGIDCLIELERTKPELFESQS